MEYWKRKSALGKRCKGCDLLMEKASIGIRSHGVFSDSECTGSFVFCFSNRVKIEGISQPWGGKQHQGD